MTNLTQHGLMPCWKGGVVDCALSGCWPVRVTLEARPRGRQGSDHATRGHARPPRHHRDDRARSSQTKKDEYANAANVATPGGPACGPAIHGQTEERVAAGPKNKRIEAKQAAAGNLLWATTPPTKATSL
eukprot:7816356-Alexandrium_andersonii.AAC.1